MDVASGTVLLRPCQTCPVGFLSVSDPDRYQNCTGCRAQNRLRDSRNSSSSPSEATPRNAKQKSAKVLQNLEVQAKQAATRMELTSSESGTSSQEVRKRASKRGPRVRPFTSETVMYGALTKKVLDAFNNRKFLEFHGVVHHFVHVKTINHQIRVTAIAAELVDFGHLLFDRECDSETVEIGDSWYSITYPCKCQSVVGEDCNGKVKVTAETNEFYPGGVGRQKTTVRVYHT